MVDAPSKSKYSLEHLIRMFHKAAQCRNEMNDLGLNDNGGAIHSAERILELLGLRLNYFGLNHINNLRNYPGAEFSPAALEAHERGEPVQIEHVSPHRALTRKAIEEIENGASDQEFTDYIRKHYRLVLLTAEEKQRLGVCATGHFRKVQEREDRAEDLLQGVLGSRLGVDRVSSALWAPTMGG